MKVKRTGYIPVSLGRHRPHGPFSAHGVAFSGHRSGVQFARCRERRCRRRVEDALGEGTAGGWDLSELLGHLPTGVMVIASCGEDGPVGMAVNSVARYETGALSERDGVVLGLAGGLLTHSAQIDSGTWEHAQRILEPDAVSEIANKVMASSMQDKSRTAQRHDGAFDESWPSSLDYYDTGGRWGLTNA